MSAMVQRTWTTANGLPQNTVNAVLQARNGYLWIATFGGLCRFDGVEMRTFDTGNTPGLRDDRVLALHEGEDGTLWIGTENAGLVRYRDGEFELMASSRGKPVRCIADAGDGGLVLVVQDHLARWGASAPGMLAPAETSWAQPHSLLRRRDGTLLLTGPEGLAQLDGVAARRLAGSALSRMAEGPDGTVWVGGEHGLFRLGPTGLEAWQPIEQLRQPVRALLGAADGAVWIATGHDVLRVADAAPARSATAGAVAVTAMTQAVLSLAEDASGGIWVGTEGGGLTRLAAADITRFGVASGLPATGVHSVIADGHGGVYVGTDEGLFRGVAGRFAAVPAAASPAAQALALDPDGSLWIGGVHRLLQLHPGDTGATEVPLAGAGVVRAILRDAQGELWLGTEDGARVLRDHALSPRPAEAWLRGETVKLLVEGPDGSLWIGGSEHLLQLDRQRRVVRSLTSGLELPFGEVRAVLPANDCTWVACYGGGICRLSATGIRIVDERRGLFDNSICSVVPVDGPNAQLAVGSNRGYFLVSTAALTAVADGSAPLLCCRALSGPGDDSSEASGGVQPSAAFTAGRVWFCGLDGLVGFEVAALRPPPPPPCCHVAEVVAGDARWSGGRDLQTPAGLRGLFLRLTACAFEHPDRLRFRWRLAGVQPWSPPSYSRQAPLELPGPGDFTFEAEAVDEFDQRSGEPVQLHLQVPPLPYETTWFRIAVGAGLLAFAVLMVAFGASRAASRAALLQRLVDQRTAALRAAHETLEHRVRERTEELQQALQQLQADHEQRRLLERQVQQLQRLESLGQLAGGVAHDFNNLLTVVLGSSSLLQRRLQHAEAHVQELVANIRDAGERGRRLTQHLLGVASRQVVVPEVLQLSNVVEGLAVVLQPLLGADVRLEIVPCERPVRVHAAASQIEQLLINLCVNARDAMPHGGRVEIAVVASGNQVGILVRDDGTGMAPEVRDRVFDPFFTTKSRSQAAGLGLSTVFGITKQLGGNVTVDSEPGTGSLFTIWLPAVEDAAAPPVLIPAAAPVRTSGRLLLIEDQDEVRVVLRRLLEQQGYAVVDAADGDAAVTQLRQAPATFDAVVSDVVMPGLQGMDLVQALRALRPELPIVFVSGYIDGKQTHRLLLEAGIQVLAKPPKITDLVKAVERSRSEARCVATPGP